MEKYTLFNKYFGCVKTVKLNYAKIKVLCNKQSLNTFQQTTKIYVWIRITINLP